MKNGQGIRNTSILAQTAKLKIDKTPIVTRPALLLLYENTLLLG